MKRVVQSASYIHSVDGGDAEEGSVGEADVEGVLGDVAHLARVDRHAEAHAAAVDRARVQAVHDGEAGHLPVRLLLHETIIGAQRVIWHALSDVALVKVVALGPVETVHISFTN
eukprot:CAMPEP_0170452072 /NCGR_PEP_ID=MMETSP0123-20130129/1100_1 /TAXON_ID=182087 /ORGANISM="Favella ehrenbergii, Strain Fehren 1" /LENGTH=113 /DNA_ID=CAMNT_0010713971 /DNA_START=135 /DNA_END=476 /DNA_ORIENTATION=-